LYNLILRPKKEKPVIQNHPWIFSGAIEKIEGDPQDGDIVSVLASNGNFLAKGYLNRKSQITVRVLTREYGEEVDESFFRRRIAKAINYRMNTLRLDKYGAYRLIHDSADMLPGIIVDKYSNHLVVQILSLGIEKRKDQIIDILDSTLSPDCIYERSDSSSREKEGLNIRSGLIRGDQPYDLIINQNGLKLIVDIRGGQKTGAFLDQRENLEIVASYARGRDMLDCFCYTGGFSVCSALQGANSVTGIDMSMKALEIAEQNSEINNTKCQFVQEDAFKFLNECDRKFDLIVLDPPGFAKSNRDIEKAAKAYKHINMRAMRILNTNGILATFSCSHHIDALLFRKIVFAASVDAGCNVRIIRMLHAAPDHPINIAYPEGEYLKGMICQRID